MYIRIKRMMDFVFALIGLIILSPLFLIIALWIKFDSPGPVFFQQKRVGIDKTYFDILKFRTMRSGTSSDMPAHLLEDSDSYTTNSGYFIRKMNLNGLPQLINILKGEMSVVGPRPALWNQYDLIKERDKYKVNDLLPGLTGWAQINGGNELPIHVQAKLDGDYASQLGFKMDIECLVGAFVRIFTADSVVEVDTRATEIEKAELEEAELKKVESEERLT